MPSLVSDADSVLLDLEPREDAVAALRLLIKAGWTPRIWTSHPDGARHAWKRVRQAGLDDVITPAQCLEKPSPPFTRERVRSALGLFPDLQLDADEDAAVPGLLFIQAKGDIEGHPFHGNQWTGGGGGEGKPSLEPAPASATWPLAQYTSGQSSNVNRYLHTGALPEGHQNQQNVKDLVSQLDSAFHDAPTAPAGMEVYRGISTHAGDPAGFLTAQVGDTIRDPGFVSTTTDADKINAGQFGNVHLEIQVAEGTPYLSTEGSRAGIRNESEVLLPRGGEFQVLGISGEKPAGMLGVPYRTLTVSYTAPGGGSKSRIKGDVEGHPFHGNQWTASGEGTHFGGERFVSPAELQSARDKAQEKFAAATPPTQEEHDRARERIAKLGSAKYHNQTAGNKYDRASRRDALVKEFGDGKTAPCIYCGVKMDAEGGKVTGVGMTQDHIYPASQGGSFRIANLVPACAGCNRSRGDKAFGDISWQ